MKMHKNMLLTLPQTLRLVALLAISSLFLVPFYLILRNSLMTDAQITSRHWYWFPTVAHWENFTELFTDPTGTLLTGLENSILIAIVTVVLQLAMSSMAGYALARIPCRASNGVFLAILATLMIPSAVTFVPTFAVMAFIGGINTRWGIVAPGLFSAFSIYLFRQFYLRFPKEIEEAGSIDGLGHFGIYWNLLLPNSKSIIATLGMLAFIGSWNAFLWPLVIGQDPSDWTVQVALSTYLTAQTIQLSQLFAAGVVAVAPVVLIFIAAQHYIKEGLVFTGGKE
jgi:multiple sugar transport system permease protein